MTVDCIVCYLQCHSCVFFKFHFSVIFLFLKFSLTVYYLLRLGGQH